MTKKIKPEGNELEHGSVSMESVMDTVTRVLASVAVLGAIFGLLVSAYSGIGTKVTSVQTSGDVAVTKVTDYIKTANVTGHP
jgi:hypothetical protein